MIENVYWSYAKHSCQVLMKLEFSQQTFDK